MLVNLAGELARSLRWGDILLRRRARSGRRRPAVVIPPMLGTRFRDGRGRRLWGWTRCIFYGPPVGRAPRVVLDGPLTELPLVPGLYSRDVHGGMLRYLERMAGYRRGDDLFVLTYDWRRGVVHAAERLAELLETIDGPAHLVCLSSAGLVARYFSMYGGRDVLDDLPTPGGEGAAHVDRVVYLGTPHRGTLEALNVLKNGFRMLPLIGKQYPAADMVTCQITYDLLPHPEEEVFIDEAAEPVDRPLHEPAAWRDLGLVSGMPHDFDVYLERARRLHLALSHAGPEQDAVVIGARHLPTRSRIQIEGGRARVPECWLNDATPAVMRAAGDGTVPESSLRGLTAAHRAWHITPNIHHDIPSDPQSHRFTLEALMQHDG